MPPGAENLDELIDRWLAEELADSPVRATALGILGYDDLLGDFSAEAFAARDARDAHWLAQIEALDGAALSFDQAIDRDLLASHLRGRRIMSDWQVWRRDPSTYLGPCLQGVFLLFLHRLDPEPELVEHATARLRSVPAVLAAAKHNLDPELANSIVVRRGAEQGRAAVRYARDLVPGEVTDPGLRSQLAEAGEIAAAAFEDLGRHLEDLAARAQGTYAIGEGRYSALLEERELLGYGAEEMRERGRRAWAELDAEMTDLAQHIDRAAAGDGGWRAVVEQLNADHPPTPEAMRAAYEETTGRARGFLVDRGLVTLPGDERCLVEPSPPFQRPILAVASYAIPPPFRPGRLGHFFVPFPPDGTSPEEVQQRLATNSHATIPTVAVHEAYPGHHWHLTWMKDNPRPLRKVVVTPYFIEGWGLYAERVMREEGFFSEPRQELAHLDARIFRAARIVVDTGLHIGDISFEEAVEFMRTRASLTEPTARAEVGRYCSWPTQAAAYLTGALEIERIRAGYLGAGRGSLREFHDTIAGSGGLPIAHAEPAVTGAQ
jgi:uncharacterized protein (DUF885 family)